MSASGGPCGPLSQQGTGPPDNSANGLCGTSPGPGTFDFYIYQGDDWRRTIRWESGSPPVAVDLTGAAIKMSVRAGPAVNCPDVLFEAEVGSGITITAPALGEFQVLFTSAQTLLLTGSTPFFYDIQVTPAGGDLTTLLKGRIYFDLQVST